MMSIEKVSQCMEKSVENVINLLVASFRGTNEEVALSTRILSRFFQDSQFPALLLQILQQTNYKLIIRQAAVIQFIIILHHKIIPLDLLPSFIMPFSEAIEQSEIELLPILKKASNLLFLNLYESTSYASSGTIIDSISPIIFHIFSLSRYKSSLIFARSFIKLISTNINKNTFFYSSFTSKFIFELNNLIINKTEEIKLNLPELISLIFIFLSRSSEYCLPELFLIPENLQFWLPKSMTKFNLISIDTHHYLKFLSNLPKFLSKLKDAEAFRVLIGEIVSYAQHSLLNIQSNLLSIKLFYMLLHFNLIEVPDDFLPMILKVVILPQFTTDNIIETYDGRSISIWKDPHDAAICLFGELLRADKRMIQLYYSLFQSEAFKDSNEISSAFDLLSFFTSQFYEFDPQTFCSFLTAIGSSIESSELLTISFLKVLSKIKPNNRLPPDFLLGAASFAFSHLPITGDSLISYFSAISLSSLITQIKLDDELRASFLSAIPIESNFHNIFEAFFTIERDYQTQDVTSSLKKLITFFGPLISPILMDITNEIVGFFFLFASNKDIGESSIILSSIICILVDISNGDTNYCEILVDMLLNSELISNIQYEIAFDKIVEILSKIVFSSSAFSEKFIQIIPFVSMYLTSNESRNFADVSSLIELIIWKCLSNTEIDISILIAFLCDFLNSSNSFQDWVLCASIAIRIPQIAESTEMEFIFPKLLFLLKENSKCFTHFKFAYIIIEHCIQYHLDAILSAYSFELDSIFTIYLNYSTYPSFLDSVIKSYANIPDHYKPIVVQTAIKVAIEKNTSEYDEYFEEEEEGNESPKAIWCNENEIMSQFIAFCKQLLISYPQFPGRELIEELLRQSK